MYSRIRKKKEGKAKPKENPNRNLYDSRKIYFFFFFFFFWVEKTSLKGKKPKKKFFIFRKKFFFFFFFFFLGCKYVTESEKSKEKEQC